MHPFTKTINYGKSTNTIRKVNGCKREIDLLTFRKTGSRRPNLIGQRRIGGIEPPFSVPQTDVRPLDDIRQPE